MKLTALLSVGWSCLKYKLFGIRTPVIAGIAVTGKCNLRCRNCYAGQSGVQPTQEELLKRIRQMYQLGTRIFFLLGGEPSLRIDLGRIINIMRRELDCFIMVSTNGQILKAVESMAKADHVEVSIEGGEEVHDGIRGFGSHAKVRMFIEELAQRKIPFHLHMVLRPENANERQIRYVGAIAKAHNTWMTCCVWLPSGATLDEPAPDFVKTTYAMVKRLKDDLVPIKMSDQALRHAIDWPMRYGTVGTAGTLPKSWKARCLHGKLVAWLDEYGAMYPCTRLYKTDCAVVRPDPADAWRQLGEAQTCADCGNASDLTYLLGLDLDHIADSLERTVWNKAVKAIAAALLIVMLAGGVAGIAINDRDFERYCNQCRKPMYPAYFCRDCDDWRRSHNIEALKW